MTISAAYHKHGSSKKMEMEYALENSPFGDLAPSKMRSFCAKNMVSIVCFLDRPFRLKKEMEKLEF